MAAKHVALGTLGCVVLSLVMLIWLVASVLPGEKEDHENNFLDAEFAVKRTGEGPYTCAETRNCQCADVFGSAPTCGNLHTSGTCDNGYHCCREECDRCSDGKSGSGSHECNCRCVQSVSHQQCQNYISTCYRPWAEVTYTPDTPTSVMTTKYNNCLAAERPSSECRAEFLSVTANLTASCAIDQRTCATNWLDQFTIGGEAKGVYNKNNYEEVHLGVPSYTASGGLIAGIILSSMALCGCGVATCIAGCMAMSSRGSGTTQAPTNLHTGIKSRAPVGGAGIQMQQQPGYPPVQPGGGAVPMAQPVAYPGTQQPHAPGYPPAQPNHMQPGYGQAPGYPQAQQPYPGAQQPYPGAQQPYPGAQQPYPGAQQQPYPGAQQQPYPGVAPGAQTSVL